MKSSEWSQQGPKASKARDREVLRHLSAGMKDRYKGQSAQITTAGVSTSTGSKGVEAQPLLSPTRSFKLGEQKHKKQDSPQDQLTLAVSHG